MEGRVQRERLTLHSHLTLLHRFEQRRLCLRRRAVDLIGEQESSEDRTGPEHEVGLALVEDEGAGHVRRQQVRRELDPPERQAERLRKRTSGERLAQARNVLEQDVAAGQDPGEDEFQGLVLADNGGGDATENSTRGR